ncbi:cytochrome c oxidase subunit II [Caldimonas mangrovi]
MQGVARDRCATAYRRRLPRRRGAFFWGTVCQTLAGCHGAQSALDPAGPAAHAIATLWWWMLGYGTLVLLGVVGLWLLALRRQPRHWGEEQARRTGRRWLVFGGLLLPFGSVAVLLAFGIPAGHRLLPLPLEGPQPMRVDVVAHQWWWEIRYPGTGVQLVDELRLPAGRPVDVHTTSRDVIHSFWVPRLGGKIDAIPGRTNVIRLQADAPGLMRGQCAEFCGDAHAHMTMQVRVMPADQFDAWLAAPRP